MPAKLQNPYNLSKLLVRSSLFFLVLIAFLGLFLRVYPFFYAGVPFTNFLHAHSHGAFLGWVFLCINGIIIQTYFSQINNRFFSYLLLTDVFLLFLMLISFAIQGYGVISIILSALHIIISWYVSLFYLRLFSQFQSNKTEKLILGAAIIFQMISGIFPMLLGYIISQFGSGSIPYYNAIYTYLHFQYNGFFTFCILAFCIRYYSNNQIEYAKVNLFVKCLILSVVLTLFNSYLWAKPQLFFYLFSFIGAACQITAVIGLFYLLFYKSKFTQINLGLLKYIFILIFIKSVLQTLTSFPSIAEVTASNRFFIISYLHLVLIGIITIPLLYFIENLTINKTVFLRSTNMKFIMSGFILTELTLLFRGILFEISSESPQFYTPVMVISTVLLVLGFAGYTASAIKKRE